MNESQLVTQKETTYFILVVIASISIYFSFFISIIGIPILIVLFFIQWIISKLSLVSIRKNGVRISEQQFPNFYAKAEQMANQMGLSEVPSIYVIQSGGLLNAFATKYGLKNMVVLYSDVFALIEQQSEDEVLYILAHEFAHVKRRHIAYAWLLMPGLSIPFLSSAYSRACEYTCDRYGAYYSNSVTASKNALMILAIGPQLYKNVNQYAFVQQANEDNGVFGLFDEITSTHPSLPKRIHAIEHFYNPHYTQKIKPVNTSTIVSIIGVLLFGTALLFGSIWAFTKASAWAENTNFASTINALAYDKQSMNDLMLAVIDDDYNEVKLLSMESDLLKEANDDGYTALHVAVIEENIPLVKLLLEAGSPVNTYDVYDYSPLLEAVYYENVEIVELLLQYGVDEEEIGYAYDTALAEDFSKLIPILAPYTK